MWVTQTIQLRHENSSRRVEKKLNCGSAGKCVGYAVYITEINMSATLTEQLNDVFQSLRALLLLSAFIPHPSRGKRGLNKFTG
jgi:hypothetical protein